MKTSRKNNKIKSGRYVHTWLLEATLINFNCLYESFAVVFTT